MSKQTTETILGLPNFSMSMLNDMMQKRYLYCKTSHCSRGEEEWFWEELEMLSARNIDYFNAVQYLINSYPYPDEYDLTWSKMNGDNVVGEVYSQNIGVIEHKHTKHVYSWMYVKSTGLAISEHGHNRVFVVQGNRYVYRIKELYYFCNSGKLEVCEEGETHSLVNDTGEDMYVVSCKIIPKIRMRRSNWYRQFI